MTDIMHGRTSIVIVAWRVRELLRACLASIAAHEDVSALEIWVVDNGSADGTAAMVAADFPSVRLITLDHNPGFAAASNCALRRATGDVCILLNPDTEIAAPALSALAVYLRAHPDVGVAGPRLINPDGTFQSAGYAMPSLFQVWYDLVPWPRRFYHSRLNGRYPDAPGGAPYDVGFPLGACLAVRREALNAVGLVDEGYGMYMEEPDLCARVRAAGYAVRIVPAATVTHHGGRSTAQVPEAMFLALHWARRRFYRTHYPAWWNCAARLLARAGMIVATYRAFRAFRRGELAGDACRQQARRFGQGWRVWGDRES